MKINADFKQRVVVHSEQLQWVASPMQGVDRRALDRVGKEVARATSIVRYAPGSQFSPHVHTGGEEFIVLEGVFQDEHGDYPAGSYVRNPPQSSHTPSSAKGCVIFVKLWQFQMHDRHPVNMQFEHLIFTQSRQTKGLRQALLFEDAIEQVSLYDCSPNTKLDIEIIGGAELLVLSGELKEQNDLLSKHSWLRLPIGDKLQAIVGEQGARLWIKTGHLREVNNQIKRVQSV